jgi:GNAT superfamily N-acetyltransferase
MRPFFPHPKPQQTSVNPTNSSLSSENICLQAEPPPLSWGRGCLLQAPEVPEAFFWNLLVLGRNEALPGEEELDEIARRHLSAWQKTGHRTLLRLEGWGDSDRRELEARGFVEDPILILERSSAGIAAPALPPTLELRSIAPDDEAAWEEMLESRCASQSRWPPQAYRRVIAGRMNRWRRHMKAADMRWWALRQEGRIISDLGAARLRDAEGESLRYAMIFSHPDLRGRGHASALILHAARVAADQWGSKTLRIGVGPDHPARKLYARLGFREETVVPYFIRWPEAWKTEIEEQ